MPTSFAPPPSGYRWLVEEDATQHPVPGVSSVNILAFQMHRSYMPAVATGTDKDIAGWQPERGKYYIISVVPDFAQDTYCTYRATYNMSATTILPGQASATVKVQPSPLPAAQIVVLAFEDNHPINGEPDQDGERGLAGFTVRVDDGAGRYGQLGGQVSVDTFGNPLGTTYMPDAANPSGYMIDPQTLLPSVLAVGSGTILTDATGYAIVKNLPPGKYGVTLLPPNGSDWIQTSTIEGQHANDAWVKFKEPPYFAEYGPPGPHVFSGFISPTQSVPAGALNGSATVKGRIVVNHMNRPPNFGFYTGPQPDATTCWIGLNATGSGANQAIYAGACNPDGTFQIAGVPPGTYQIAVWDTALDLIHGSYGVTVNADGSTCATANNSCDLGDIPMFTWFTRIESKVFFDAAKTGFPGSNPVGIPEIPVTIRFRDGSVDQTFKTRDDGVATFNEAFPYFNWQVIEVDSVRLKPTGVTVVVDAGGPIPPDNGWTMPSKGKLNPQPQQVWDARMKTLGGPANNPNTGNNLSRTDAGPITTQAFQGFTTGTNIIDFGKAPYAPGENGGISGMVAYATVRAEDDPRYAVIEGLEPGIPHVAVIVYPKPAAGTRLNLSDVAAYTNTPDMNWRSTASDGINAKAGDAKRSKNGGGISLSAVNGQDVASNPGDPSKWFRVTMVNNIVVDNMAALAGGGISLQDVALSAIVNDTVAHNDSTATAADAFSSPLKSASQSNPQIAGIVSHGHSAALLAALARGGAAIGAPATAPLYAGFSNPDLRNSVVFQNRSFYFRVDAPVNNLPTYSLQPPVATPNYSDLGVIGAAGPAAQLAPRFSLLTNPAVYASTNVTGDPIFHAPYFDHAGNSIQEVEPTSGIQIQPAFDEGGNYIDLRFGPLTQEIFPATNPDSYYNYVPKTSAGAPSPVVAKGDPSVITGYLQAGSDINGVVRTGTRTDIGAAQAQP